MNIKKQTVKYVTTDFISSVISWSLFFLYRKFFIEKISINEISFQISDKNYLYGLLIIPFFWLTLYYLNGYYKHIYRKSRLNEFFQTFLISVLGVIIIFFTLLLDDIIYSYENYYRSVSTLFMLHFTLTYIPRGILTTRTNHKIHKRKILFNTLIVGSNEKAINLYEKLSRKKRSSGYYFVGFINVHSNTENLLKSHLTHLGNVENLKQIILEYNIAEVVIAIESKEHKEIEYILNKLEGTRVVVKAIPDNCDIISGKVKISSLYDEPLIQISHELMPQWQVNTKRGIDIFVSLFVLIICAPLYIFIGLAVKFSSKGPIIYSHERIGFEGKPFTIYKFRSMFANAEKNGPALATEGDDRITPLGKFLRKTRLDEIPQFYNVLKGDMSLVGPRPERQFYIHQIIEKAPHYVHLHKVKPGITSWGQVKYGYAQDVDEMIERLKYDIIYIENMSLFVDFKIIIYTIKTVILGKGI